MIWPFSRKAPPQPPAPRDLRDWNEDWKVGDIAECIHGPEGWHKSVPPWMRPAKGERLIVTGFSESVGGAGCLRYYLRFTEYPRGIATTAFRKVRPVSSEKSEIVERILKAKPGKDRVRVRAD